MQKITLTGHRVSKGTAAGEALVTKDPIAFFGGVDAETGCITDRMHELNGVCISGKILLFPEEKGSAGSSMQLYEMKVCGTQPAAMINIRCGSTVAVGAIASDIPMVDDLSPDPYIHIKTGDWVEVDATNGIVTVHPR